MQPGEVLVVRLKRGLTLGRFSGEGGSKVRIAIGRNRDAQLPSDRVVLATGIVVSRQEEVGEIRERCEALASEVDLSDVWDVVCEAGAPVTLAELAELYWGRHHDAAQRIGILLRLGQDDLYFAGDGDNYAPRSREAVEEILARRQRKAEQARESATLAEHLSEGRLPAPATRYQSGLVEHLRGYAVHGDNYTRSTPARALLEQVEDGTRDLQRLAFELLVRAGIFSPDEHLELEREGIATDFSKEALAEAAAIDASRGLSDPRREDLTSLPAITIDETGTEDRDDALSLVVEEPETSSPVDSPRDRTVYCVGVHIADAGALIPRGGPLDRDAGLRMATLYLPEGKLPMLPREVCDHAGSLVACQDRAALSLLVRLTGSGDVLEWNVVPSVVRSRAALSYDDADSAIADGSHPRHPMLDSLARLARALRDKREQKGAISIDRPEMVIKAGESGDVEVRVAQHATPAKMLVAEFMILCNSLLAEFCSAQGLPAAYRSQAAPDLSGLPADAPEGPLRWYQLMRRLAPADIGPTPARHAGLGVAAYLQATSPIRRYPDLVMQRQISHFLNAGQVLYSADDMASVAHRADVQLRELGRLEEERKRYWFLKHLRSLLAKADKAGQTSLFQGVVLENKPRRLALLELSDYPYRVRADLPSGVAPGETVTLRLHGVDLWRRTAQFVHVVRTV